MRGFRADSGAGADPHQTTPAPPGRDEIPTDGRHAPARNFTLSHPFHCDYGSNIYCGSNVSFSVNFALLDVAKVTVGSNVVSGLGVQLYAADHPLDAVVRRPRKLGRPIIIGDDC